ncbi:MAG: ATP-binding protein [Candidatus Saccharimonadales bacterium]
MFKLNIANKILIYFLLVSLLPMVVTTYIIVSSANNQLLNAASSQQQAIAKDLADRVGNYISSKINNLVYLAQLYSSGNLTPAGIGQNMAVLLNSDTNMQRIAIVNSSGNDQVVFDRNGQVFTLQNESQTDAFKAVNFLSGKAYVSSVSYNHTHQPIITIAVPVLVSNYAQHLTDLGKANFGSYNTPSDIRGAVIANFNMSTLWQSVLSTKIGNGGYAYVVDGLGNLVAYHNIQFLTAHPKLSNVQAVRNFINDDLKTSETISETNQKVISTPRVINDSGWAVIVEEPVNSIYSDVNSFVKLATYIGLSAIVLAIGLSVFFRYQLIVPIRRLTQGAKKFGRGDFEDNITLKNKDELYELAQTFNAMGASIKKLVNDLKLNNLILSAEQTKLSNIISSVSDGVIAVNEQGRILSANPPAAKLINQRTDHLAGVLMSDIYKWQQENKPFQPKLDTPGLQQYNDITLDTGTGIAYLNLVVSVIKHKDNEVAAIITIHDMTQSRELDFMKLDFVAIAAHELRTPLTVVRGYLDMLSPEAIDKMTLAGLENLQKAMESTDQLRDLINKLLNIARIERGEMELFIEKVNIEKIIKENVRQHQSTAADKEQRLVIKSDTEHPVYVPADPSSLTEVLNNLIGNAIKYTPKGGEITVRLLVNNQVVRIEVTDNGPGIPEELRSRLFTKFYRAERSLIAGTHGTGLGLFISKTIIELQNGTIGLEPDKHNGSTFYFTLPLYNADKYDNLINRGKQIGGIHGWFKERHVSRG